MCSLQTYDHRVGVWAPTVHQRGWQLSCSDAVRGAYFDWLVSEMERADLPPVLRDGDIVRVTPIWSGYLHNAATLAALGLFGMSLVGGGRSLLLRGRKRRIEQGLCAGCAYDRAGLPMDVCPECGERVE